MLFSCQLCVEQLAALINDSIGVIATNTAAIQFAHAREKPWYIFIPYLMINLLHGSFICSNTCMYIFSCSFNSIALFSSEEKGKLFVPDAEEKRCTILSSKTGKLADIDVGALENAIKIFERPLALV